MEKGRGLGVEPSPRVGHAVEGRAMHAPTVFSQVARDCPVLAWSEGVMLVLREVVCGWGPCGRVIWLCSGCDRGQRYCGQECRELARASNRRRAQREYARSPRGREMNRERQRRYRARQAARKRNGSPFTEGSGGAEMVPCTELAATPGENAAASAVTTTPCAQEAVRIHLPYAAAGRGRGCWSSLVTSSCDRGQARHGEERRCHICGGIGRVVRRAASRGRFRWVDEEES